MKRIVIGIILSLVAGTALFAQNDLQPLAVVKLNKSETITLKQLRTRADAFQKQAGLTSITPEQRKEILEALIDEKLVVQAAQKEGLTITDSQVNARFLNILSQYVGKPVTEAEFADIIKKNTGKGVDEYMISQVGMNVADFKANIKNQMIIEGYVLAKKKNEINALSPSDEEIRAFYEMNKKDFVWTDMLKLYLVTVPNGKDKVAARATATDMYNKYKKDPKMGETFKKSEENGKSYQAVDLLVEKSAQHARQLGMSSKELLAMFNKDIGFVSDLSVSSVNGKDQGFYFYAILKKYSAKQLDLFDIAQPDSNITVYENVREYLTAQMEAQFKAEALQEIIRTLDTPENVDRKKTGNALLEILSSW